MPISPKQTAYVAERLVGQFTAGPVVEQEETALTELRGFVGVEDTFLAQLRGLVAIEDVLEASTEVTFWEEVFLAEVRQAVSVEDVMVSSTALTGYAAAVAGDVATPLGSKVDSDVEIEWNGTVRPLDDETGPYGVAGFTVDEPVNGAAEWSLSVDDEEWKLDPDNPGTWQSWLRPAPNPGPSGRYTKVVRLAVKMAGTERVLCRGPIHRRTERSGRSNPLPVEQLGGFDLGRLLLRPNVSLQTYTSSYDKVVTNKQILQDLADLVGLGLDAGRLTTMAVPQFHMQGETPLAAVDRIVRSSCGHWAVDDGVLVVWDPVILPASLAFRTFDLDAGVAEELVVNESSVEVVNVITVDRFTSADDAIAEDAKTDATYGRYSVSFSKPVSPMSVVVEEVEQHRGMISDVWLLDEAGRVCRTFDLRGLAPPVVSAGPAVSASFTWGQPPNLPLLTQGDYEVRFYGKGADDPAWFGAEFDEVRSKTYRFQTSISEDDEMPMRIFDPLLPNEPAMRRRAIFEFNERQGKKLQRQLRAPFDPEVKRGHTLRVKYVAPDGTVDLALYVTHVHRSFEPDPAGRFNVYTLVPVVGVTEIL